MEQDNFDGEDSMKTFKSVVQHTLSSRSIDIRMFVTGKTGAGKSALVNSIVEVEVAVEGAGTERETTSVSEYRNSKLLDGVSVSLFDSPGLADTTEKENDYIHALETICQEVNLVLYCNKMDDHRLTNDDIQAMSTLTDKFGEKFWKYVVFVFTFANNVGGGSDKSDNIPKPKTKNLEEWKSYFKIKFVHRLNQRILGVKQLLKDKIKVKKEIVDDIPFVPVGSSSPLPNNMEPLKLPDRDNWLHSLLETCCVRIKKNNFIKFNLTHRFHLAVVINNDIQDSKNSQDLAFALPKNIYMVENSLQSLGFHVLYFSDLTSEIIDMLLTVLLQSDISDLATLAFIIFSKGKNPQLYDADSNEISFEMIFDHFQKLSIPTLIFLHMNHSDANGLMQLPNTPSNSIVLAVSHHSKENSADYISTAIDIFVKEMQSEAEPINVIFKRIEAQCNIQKGISGLCKSSLGDHITFSACYEVPCEEDRVNQVGKWFQFCQSKWRVVRRITVDHLLASKDDILDVVRKARIAKIATAATSLAVGGTLTVIGLALIPFTFGGSVALSVAGAGIGVGSTTAGTVSYFVAKVTSNKKLKAAQKYIEFDKQFTTNVQTIAIEYEEAIKEATTHGLNAVVVGARFGTGINNKRISFDAQVFGEGATLGAQVVGRAVGGALGGVALAFTAPLDIYHIVQNGYNLAMSHQDKSGRYDRDTVCQWLIKQSENMLKDLLSTVHESKLSVEESGPYTLDTYCGCKICVQENSKVPDEKCDIFVRTIFGGQFELPPDTTLASALYDITIKGNLLKPINICIQHCVDSKYLSKLSFAIVEFNLDNKSFDIVKLDDGDFSADECSIELNKSCFLCILCDKDEEKELPLKYAAVSYYNAISSIAWKKTVLLIKYLDAHIKFAKGYETEKDNYSIETSQFHFISSNAISFEHLKETIKLTNGWSICCDHIPKKISQSDIDIVQLSDIPKLSTIKWNITAYDDDQMAVVSELDYDVPPLKNTDLRIHFKCKQSF